MKIHAYCFLPHHVETIRILIGTPGFSYSICYQTILDMVSQQSAFGGANKFVPYTENADVYLWTDLWGVSKPNKFNVFVGHGCSGKPYFGKLVRQNEIYNNFKCVVYPIPVPSLPHLFDKLVRLNLRSWDTNYCSNGNIVMCPTTWVGNRTANGRTTSTEDPTEYLLFAAGLNNPDKVFLKFHPQFPIVDRNIYTHKYKTLPDNTDMRTILNSFSVSVVGSSSILFDMLWHGIPWVPTHSVKWDIIPKWGKFYTDSLNLIGKDAETTLHNVVENREIMCNNFRKNVMGIEKRSEQDTVNMLKNALCSL